MNDITSPYEIAILVIPKYSQLTLAALVEPLRMANTVSDQQLYNWTFCSDGHQKVTSSSGFDLAIGFDISEMPKFDALFVVASYETMHSASKNVFAFLRKAARHDAIIGGLDAAPYLLAEAGLLDGYRATTHWDDLEDFRYRYPNVDVVPERYVIDRKRITTSGSLPSFDFMLDFIRRHNGLMLAMNVSGNFLYDQARPASEPQYMVAAASVDGLHPKIKKVIKLMEQNLQAPLTMAELAAAVGLSERSLLRRFRNSLDTTPYEYYRSLKLDMGRRLLGNSDLNITEIALACGFDSRGSFTRAFKKTFGMPPSRHRHSTK